MDDFPPAEHRQPLRSLAVRERVRLNARVVKYRCKPDSEGAPTRANLENRLDTLAQRQQPPNTVVPEPASKRQRRLRANSKRRPTRHGNQTYQWRSR
jgi:RNA processing factor Prp31